jgi:hypothetical protein
MNLTDLGRLTEDEARRYLECIRWPNGPVCPHCQGTDCTRLQGEAHRAGVIQCNSGECRRQFTVTVGSVMESSHVPLQKWAMAFHLICSSKKGYSAKQLQRNLGLGSYRTAWFMLHRIRFAMTGEPAQKMLKGDVEVDETYVGGKPRHAAGVVLPKQRGRPKQLGLPRTTKTPVVALVQRDGAARCRPVQNVSREALHAEVLANVAQESTIHTDEYRSYRGLGKHFNGGHQRVNHSRRRYARRNQDGALITTNTAESFFALLKRGHYGVYHSMSKQHLHRYCDEFAFRWTHRKVNDAARTEAAIEAAEGKRLLYETPQETTT